MSDNWIVVEFTEEFASLLVVSDLSKLEGNGSRTVLRVLGLLDGSTDGVEDGSSGLACRLTVGDGNDQNRLAHLSATNSRHENAVDDLLAELSTHRGETAELVASNQLLDLLLSLNVLDHVLGRVVVHESDRDAVVVEESRGGSNTLKDKLKILDTLAVLLELHRATVVNVENNVVQGELDNVVANLLVDAPLLAKAVDLSRGLLGDLVDDRRARRVESLEALLLDSLLKRLLVSLDFSRAGGLRRSTAVAALRSSGLLSRVSTLLLLGRVAALLLGRCAISTLLLLRRLALWKELVSKLC